MDDAIPAELERICLKALARRASDRYANASEMADDLDHWAEGPRTSHKAVAIVPRGLRSFGPDDADFFLELLPGPRGRDGLPESIRFWKARIEETDPDGTFDVGLIYGPSGCGKSSLVKAGLIPNLSDRVIALYVEATADDTENRILRGLRKALPELPDELGLVETFMTLRRFESTRGRKVVVILDQFEQWLHARRADREAELITSLRQCDGGRLQAIVMVRDDFSMAASRFMRELETPIVEGHNFATIDLFEHDHAVKVLARFGQAFGKLPDQASRFSEAERRFLDTVVSGLGQDGKVVSVRLALFSEMVKDKPWIPATLDEVGGTEGIGVNFLEETFHGRRANPEHQRHQQAARQILKALLPEVGTDIKGHMRSHDELLAASGYVDRPVEFRDVLRILDGALRLITPTDPDGSRSDSGSDPGAKFFQLTHDYLVPSLREWLTRKQKETGRGRAELQLAELSSLWNARRENRLLPEWDDFLTIRRLVPPEDWTPPQRRMMRRAATHHAKGAVQRLLDAELSDIPALLSQVRPLRKRAIPLLREAQMATADGSRERRNTALALLELDERQGDYLYGQLLRSSPSEFPILRDALAGRAASLSAMLWHDASGDRDDDRRLRAAAALASYEPESANWEAISAEAARLLTLAKPEFLVDWAEAFRPVKGRLIPHLTVTFRDDRLGELQRALATSVLADYAASDVDLLTDLLVDAASRPFGELFPILASHGERAIAALEREMGLTASPDWKDAPPALSPAALPCSLRRSIEAAAGIAEERFLLTQTLPEGRFDPLSAALHDLGYRPSCVRPFRVGSSPLVAAIWVRDGRAGEVLRDAAAPEIIARDEESRSRGLVPIDVSVDLGPDARARYTAVWAEAAGGEHIRLVVGDAAEDEDMMPPLVPEDHPVAAVSLLDCGHAALLFGQCNRNACYLFVTSAR